MRAHLGGGAVETTQITGIAAGGAGVGRLRDGRVTFVHRTAPGDRVEVRVVEEKPRWTRSVLVRVLEASPDRRVAPCPHYDRCGGCTLEHLHYLAQLRAKGRILVEALRRIGKREIEEPEVVPSPREVRYRNRVTFTLLRTGGGRVVAGFRELEHPERVLDIGSDCLLPEPAVAAAWGALRRAWGPGASRLPSGEELRLTLRGSRNGTVALAVDGGYAPGRPRELLDEVAGLAVVWQRSAGAAAFALLAGDGSLRDRWGGEEELELSGDVFTQVNRGAAERLETHVLERVRAAAPETVVDAYCGVGLHARRLARAGVRVRGIEVSPEAVEEARRAAPGATFLEGRVEARLEEALPADLVVLNPPRGGVHAAVARTLRRARPGRLVYVSCDPATLARDVQRLGEAYRVTGVRCFDLFPQTAHVETVMELECATM